MTPFARALRAAREKRGISQSKLADRADLCHSYVSRLESGQRNPSRETVDLIADALGMPDGEREALLASAGFTDETAPRDPLLLDVQVALGRNDETARMLRLVIGAMLDASREAVAV
jgi:transcriptional regulator with XRE-family HTH domain